MNGVKGTRSQFEVKQTNGAPGRDRTCDQRIRNPLLYPLSYGCFCQKLAEAQYARFFQCGKFSWPILMSLHRGGRFEVPVSSFPWM